MATITIRNIPGDVMQRIKDTASRHGVSMEHEIRELLKSIFMTKKEILNNIRKRWDNKKSLSVEILKKWRNEGRL